MIGSTSMPEWEDLRSAALASAGDDLDNEVDEVLGPGARYRGRRCGWFTQTMRFQPSPRRVYRFLLSSFSSWFCLIQARYSSRGVIDLEGGG